MLFRGAYVPLPEDRARVMRSAPFTYPAAGVTREAAGRPPLFLPFSYSRVIGSGERRFHRASAAVLTWRAQLGAGLDMHASSAFVGEGVVVDQRLGPFSMPCRVVYVVDEPRRKGFAYGTVAGRHPERGEELFLLALDPETDEVRVEIRSLSMPAPLWLPLWPVLRAVQEIVLRAVQEIYVRRFADAIEAASA